MIGRALRGVVGAAALASVTVLAPGQQGVVRAAEYTMSTTAAYTVAPDKRQVTVDVEVTFENTTPDPSGQFSLFEVVDLAVQQGASGIAATDADGSLTVDRADKDGYTLVSVHLRDGLRYQQRAVFHVAYELDDGASAQVRIRPSVIAFPVWGFGTASDVTVTLPDRYEVRVDGNELSATRGDGIVTLESGAIDDPSAWLARITAVGPSSYRTFSQAVPLGSATVDLQVRAWSDDTTWGEDTLTLLIHALPLLEEQIGLPYPDVGPLVVVESVTGPTAGFDAPDEQGTQLQVGYDQPPFVVVHQAAHAWFSQRLASDRWMREGFASWAASRVAGPLGIGLPFDPSTRGEELSAAAFPLVSWGAGAASDEQQAWAYAASWDVADRVAAAVGDQRLQRAWQRIVGSVGPYAPVTDEPVLPDGQATPVVPADSRQLLDQLEAVSSADVAAILAESVLDPDTAALLPARADARQALEGLLAAAGSWGAPEPVTVDLAAWRFDSAARRISDALTWLAARDQLMSDAERVGLTVPQRLRDRYRTAGGGPDAQTELDAERAVVDAYGDVLGQANAGRSILERIGLIGGPEPASLLSDANRLFTEGELRGAAESIEAARLRLNQAETDGIVRLAAAALLVLAALIVAVRLARRRRPRRGRGYTAAP